MSGKLSGAAASWPRYALPRGATVNGYTIERVLGSGGFGVTYLARDDLHQYFAVKEFFPREFAARQDQTVFPASDETTALFNECLDRFRREAQALVRLSRSREAGDGVVRVMTYFTANGTGFLVMEYVEGATLAGVLREEPNGLDASRVSSLLTQLLSSVATVHRSGLLHRDIKPANIILRENGGLVLIDFGSSREAASGLTRTYTQIYSAGYAPLEQMIPLPQGPFSDIYAIGAVCYHAIGGKLTDALTRHLAQLAGKPDPLPAAEQIGRTRYPGPLLRAIDAALEVNPERRPRDVDAMLALLNSSEEEEGDATVRAQPRPRPVVVPAYPVPPMPSRLFRRGALTRRHKWTLGVVACALTLAGTAYFVPWHVIVEWDVARHEAARQETARQEVAREEAAQREATRQEALRQDEARQEASRQQAAQQEVARQEAARQEAARQEADRQELARQETERRLEQIRREAAQPVVQPGASTAEPVWSDTERRDIQAALTGLGHYHGPINGSLGVDASQAIRAWQAFESVAETGSLTGEQRGRLLHEAEGQAALLKVSMKSPRGTSAETVKGGQARFLRGSAFERGDGQQKDYAEAAYWYALAASDGWAQGYTNLGTLRARGLGMPQPDNEAARRLWLTAAALGEVTALFNLGALAEKGIGEPVDLDLAKRWYARAAERKDAESVAALRRLGG
jgi:serine/threonine protein kinase/TPR repeat protein